MIKEKTNKVMTRKEMNELGFGSALTDATQSIINKDGTFNVKRTEISFWESFGIYNYFISMSWLRFCFFIFMIYIFINLVFTALYFIAGTEGISGISDKNTFEKFLYTFFFSTQTFTTVGYGTINPDGIVQNIIASFESLLGLLSLAFTTGLLWGRFAKPVAKIIYSKNALLAPFQESNAFQFRTANKRAKHEMVEVEVKLIFTVIEDVEGVLKRKFYNLELEYDKINFFASVWTVNHIINDNSPLNGLERNDLKDLDAEFLVLLKGFDIAYGQIVHSLYSYSFNDIIWGARFKKIYYTMQTGKMKVELDKISEYERAELNKI